MTAIASAIGYRVVSTIVNRGFTHCRFKVSFTGFVMSVTDVQPHDEPDSGDYDAELDRERVEIIHQIELGEWFRRLR